jgi:tripartite-type tricarboxylate transporter receptor subunit TctC
MVSIRTCLMAALAASVFAGPVAANEYPTRPIRLLVPYAAGGPSDAAARLLMQPFGNNLGTTVFVENRGGAGGLTGTEQVVQGSHDGYTIVLGAVGPLVFIPVSRQINYNVKSDLIPLGTIWQSPLVLVVNPKRGFKTVADFIAYAKANPGKLTVSSAGVGTNTHMASELFKREAKIDLLHVPYRGTGAAMPDLLSGQIDATISDVTVMAPHIREGKLVALAVTAQERSALLPEVPTMAEAGLPGARTENWYGLLAPGKTPPAAVAKLRSALDAAIKAQSFRDGLAKQGATIRDTGADAFGKLIDDETARWAPIIKEAGIKF